MGNYFVNRAIEKGQFKARLIEIANDVALVVKVRDGVHPLLESSYVEKMKRKYDKEWLKSEKFGKGLVYRSVLEIMSDGRVPDVSRGELKRFEGELLRYSNGAYVH